MIFFVSFQSLRSGLFFIFDEIFNNPLEWILVWFIDLNFKEDYFRIIINYLNYEETAYTTVDFKLLLFFNVVFLNFNALHSAMFQCFYTITEIRFSKFLQIAVYCNFAVRPRSFQMILVLLQNHSSPVFKRKILRDVFESRINFIIEHYCINFDQSSVVLQECLSVWHSNWFNTAKRPPWSNLKEGGHERWTELPLVCGTVVGVHAASRVTTLRKRTINNNISRPF